MEFHPAAELFPLMTTADFEALVEDIRANGLREPIWTFEGKIIDGRNRFNACRSVGVEPRYREWDGDGSLVSFVVSLNLNRRHLTESQRGLVAARLANVDGSGRPKEIGQIQPIISQGDAAKMLSVSRSTVKTSAKVLRDGVPELADMVESGEVTVSQAAKVAEFPKGKQKRLIRSGRVAGKKLLQARQKKAVDAMLKKGSRCLGCDPQAEFNQRSVSAFMQALAVRAPEFARYFNDIVEEIEVEAISSDTRNAYDKILDLIDSGVCEKADLQRACGLTRDQLSHTIATMIDYGMIEALSQGGKTDTARGATKTIYRRSEKTPDEHASDLEYVPMEFD